MTFAFLWERDILHALHGTTQQLASPQSAVKGVVSSLGNNLPEQTATIVKTYSYSLSLQPFQSLYELEKQLAKLRDSFAAGIGSLNFMAGFIYASTPGTYFYMENVNFFAG